MPKGIPLTNHEKLTIAKDYLQSDSLRDTSKKHNVSPKTVKECVNDYRSGNMDRATGALNTKTKQKGDTIVTLINPIRLDASKPTDIE